MLHGVSRLAGISPCEFSHEIVILVFVLSNGKWLGQLELALPDDIYIIMIKRGDKIIAPIHSTIIKENDVVTLASGSKEKLLKLHAAIGE